MGGREGRKRGEGRFRDGRGRSGRSVGSGSDGDEEGETILYKSNLLISIQSFAVIVTTDIDGKHLL